MTSDRVSIDRVTVPQNPLEGGVWLNEPPSWRLEDGIPEVATGQDTDFWRVTHYGFVRDNGHFYHHTLLEQDSFVAELRFSGEYQRLYDQAGLMLRLDDQNWIKAGIEYTDGKQHLSVVVTRERSDWSVLVLEDAPEWVWLRLIRRDTAVHVHYSLDGQHYTMLRLAYLPDAARVQVGPMCCSPQGQGFRAWFADFKVGPLEGFELHP